MKKIYIWMLIIGLLVMTAGCNRRADEDVYGTTAVTETISEEATTEAEASTDPESQMSDDGITTASEDEATTSVSEDVYEDDGSATETVNPEDVDAIPVAGTVEDPAFEAAVLAFLDPVYYNLFFGQGDYVDGISEEDMTKFAISYIYQHEYNELKFDTSDFILYVPEKRVEELVYRYFDYEVTGHHSFIEDNLMYEDGFYLMPAVDAGWNDVMTISSASTTGDFSYEVIVDVTNEMDESKVIYKTGIEVRNDRYVLVSYRVMEGSDSGEEAPAETTASEQDINEVTIA